MINIGATKQLFLDDYIVAGMVNCQRQFHRPARHTGNPVVRPDRPWELGVGNNGVYLFGGTVLYDEEEHLFKMWYRSSQIESNGGEGPIGVVPEGGYRSCYAISQDGLSWEKPHLAMATYRGSRATNILPATGEKKYIRRPNLIKDYLDPDPARRYKMVYANEVSGNWVLEKAYSPDGFHWQMNVGEATLFPPPLAPLGILYGWDPRLQQFVHFHRKISPGIPAAVDGRMVRAEYALMRSTSTDFEHWGNTEEILKRDPHIDPPRWDIGHAGILAAILYTEDLYIAFLDTCTTYYVEEVPDGKWDVYALEHADHRTELLFSRDGKNWQRISPHWEFMRRGLWGTWDREFVALSKPIVKDGKILIYYTGRNLPCGVQMAEHPRHVVLGQSMDGQTMGYAIGLARLRLDGFVSVEGYDPPGVLTTQPLTFTGDHLTINAFAPPAPFGAATSSGSYYGRLEVEILDASGHPVDGYRQADCDAFSDDALGHVITWRGNPDVGPLAGKTVRLKYYLKNAALFAFQFNGPNPGAATGAPNQLSLLSPGGRGNPHADRQ